MGFITGVLTCANVYVAYKFVQNRTKKMGVKPPEEEADPALTDGSLPMSAEARVSTERINELLGQYLGILLNGGEPSPSSFSPAMVRELRETQELHNKLRIRHEQSYSLYTDKEPSYTRGYVDVDNLFSYCEEIKIKHWERYTDLSTGKIIEERTNEGSTLSLWLSKQLPAMSNEAMTCSACGGQYELCGDKAFCTSCGHMVDTSTENWVISGLVVDTLEPLPSLKSLKSPKQEGSEKLGLLGVYSTMSMVLFIPVFMLLPPLFAFFDGLIPALFPITVSYNIGVWGYVIYNLYDKKKKLVQPPKELEVPHPEDNYRVPNAAIQLTRLLANMRELLPAGAAAIMDAETYRQWCKAYCHDGDYIISFRPAFGRDSIVSMPKEGTRQLATLGTKAVIAILTHNRRIIRMERDFTVCLYHNLTSGYDGSVQGRVLRCGCGRYIQVDPTAACPHCGSTYDLADYDWKLCRVETNVITDFGGKLYGTY